LPVGRLRKRKRLRRHAPSAFKGADALRKILNIGFPSLVCWATVEINADRHR
jgi:hypothetical protein